VHVKTKTRKPAPVAGTTASTPAKPRKAAAKTPRISKDSVST